MESMLHYALFIYFGLLIALAIFMSGKMESDEDFLVGGRKFNLWLTTFCLFATWFGAGTLITATDEIAQSGLRAAALEPYGAGMCLLLSGLFLAKPLWEMKLMTFADLLRQKFGPRVEFLGVIINIPIYVGWIAVQIISLANILAVFYPLPIWVFVIGISLFACFLTISGGMWSVSITDSFQLFLIVIGLIYLLTKIAGIAPDGLLGLVAKISPERLVFIPTEKMSDFINWVGVFSISALGNMTGQDLGQRMFSAKSAKVAQQGCYIAGFSYIIVGSIPVFLGLTASSTLGEYSGSVVPNLIKSYLDPLTGVIMTLTIISAVISTITSALLAPSSMISHNLLKKYFKNQSALALCKWGVLIVTIISLITAIYGENVYFILESSYAIGFVAFFAPVIIGVYSKKLDETACLIAIFVGVLVWLPELMGYDNLPYSLIGVGCCFISYFAAYSLKTRNKDSTN